MKLCGEEIGSLPIRQRTEAGISYIPEDRQGTGVFLDFNLGDNLALRQYYRAPFAKKGILQFNEFEKYANDLIQRYDIRCGQGRKTSLRSMLIPAVGEAAE